LIFEVVILKPQVFLRLIGFSPEGDTSLPVCVSHRTLAKTQPFFTLEQTKVSGVFDW
jgi:hypothetical protein